MQKQQAGTAPDTYSIICWDGAPRSTGTLKTHTPSGFWNHGDSSTQGDDCLTEWPKPDSCSSVPGLPSSVQMPRSWVLSRVPRLQGPALYQTNHTRLLLVNSRGTFNTSESRHHYACLINVTHVSQCEPHFIDTHQTAFIVLYSMYFFHMFFVT